MKGEDIYYEILLSKFVIKVSKITRRSLGALALNVLIFLCFPDFGIATKPSLDLRL